MDELIAPIDISDSVNTALTNVSDEPTKQIGHTLGDLWFLVFGGISQAAEKKRLKYAKDLENYHQELDERIKQIPAEHHKDPSLQVTAQALENSKYCVSEEELRKMFVNLISNSMDNRVSHYVHPSFPEILKQMSSLEAQIIRCFKENRAQPIANFIVKFPNYQTRMLETYEFIMDDGSYSFSYKSAISSLERLGLLSVTFQQHLVDDSLYDKFRTLPYFKHLKGEYENASAQEIVDIQKGICTVTPLGDFFIRACVS